MTDLKIPCHVLFYENGKLEHFGTPDMMKKFDNNEIGNSETWTSSLKQELLKLVEKDESVFDQAKIDSMGITNYFSTFQELKKLPAPLSVCLYTELLSYLSYLIVVERKEKGHLGAKIEFGSDSWKPDWWIEEEWAWENLQVGFKHLKAANYTLIMLELLNLLNLLDLLNMLNLLA